MEEQYYEILGVSPTATEEEIRRAYRDLVADAMDDLPRFEALSRAFDTLKDPVRRATYNERLAGTNRAATVAIPSNATRMNATGAYSTQTGAYSTQTGVHKTAHSTMAMPPTWNPPDAGVAAGVAAAFNLPVYCPASLSPCPLKSGQVIPDDGFCPECGVMLGSLSGTGPQLKDRPLPMLVDTNGREWPLKNGENVVGREGADVLLPDRSISRRHAMFRVDEKTGGVTLEDLGSTNGSRRGSETLSPGKVVTLADGMELRFGAIRLTIRIPAPPLRAISGSGDAKVSDAGAIAPKPLAALPSFSGKTSPVPPSAQSKKEANAVRLVGKSGNTMTHVLAPDATEIQVGRRPENALMITGDPYISGKHAVILHENGRYKVMDLGSTNGTRWNGRKLLPEVPQSLADGDEIIFGQTPFTFEAPK